MDISMHSTNRVIAAITWNAKVDCNKLAEAFLAGKNDEMYSFVGPGWIEQLLNFFTGKTQEDAGMRMYELGKLLKELRAPGATEQQKKRCSDRATVIANELIMMVDAGDVAEFVSLLNPIKTLFLISEEALRGPSGMYAPELPPESPRPEIIPAPVSATSAPVIYQSGDVSPRVPRRLRMPVNERGVYLQQAAQEEAGRSDGAVTEPLDRLARRVGRIDSRNRNSTLSFARYSASKSGAFESSSQMPPVEINPFLAVQQATAEEMAEQESREEEHIDALEAELSNQALVNEIAHQKGEVGMSVQASAKDNPASTTGTAATTETNWLARSAGSRPEKPGSFLDVLKLARLTREESEIVEDSYYTSKALEVQGKPETFDQFLR